ncbi:MAG TPA: 4Fe-4S dicluster domain-containing protein [Candidatus Methylomirabilis sp.]|nr:4Fe-4S dicluster domain-containing protein [Candidatus Methylomirabilis sp.]
MPERDTAGPFILTREGLGELFAALRRREYRLVGPTLADGAIVYDEIETPADLPIGWTDEQEAGTYRLRRRDDQAMFGYVVGPHSWKKFLFPPALRLWSARRAEDTGFAVEPPPAEPPRYALIGVRACELHALAIQDRVFLGGPHIDPVYRARREGAFVVAVNCGQAGGTCFCVSMKTGPRAQSGFDLALTEITGGGAHRLLVEIGSAQGAAVLAEVPREHAGADDVGAAERAVERAAARMGRIMDTTDIKDLLYRNLEHPRWAQVADRCLTCGNCTMACPTCFCTTVEDTADLSGDHAERWRKWDSCFTMDFSYVHGGAVRSSARSRYRQWMTHKLATWIDQFGSSGCVGCGRCITWCPVGIDITEEVAAIRANPSPRPSPPAGGPDHADP